MNEKIAQLSAARNNYQDAWVSQRAAALASRMAAEWLLSWDQAQALSATMVSDQSSIANLEKMKLAQDTAQMQIQAMQE